MAGSTIDILKEELEALDGQIDDTQRNLDEKKEILRLLDGCIASKQRQRETIQGNIESLGNQLSEKLNKKKDKANQLETKQKNLSWFERQSILFSEWSPMRKRKKAEDEPKTVKKAKKSALVNQLESEQESERRYDQIAHWPAENQKTKGCKVRTGRTKTICSKCQVVVLTKCFQFYHKL